MDLEENHSNESELFYDIYPNLENNSNSFYGSKVYDKSERHSYSGK